MSQAPLRVAVAGAGAFGKNHLRVYRELETAGPDSAGLPVALVAAVEPDTARAAEAAAIGRSERPSKFHLLNIAPNYFAILQG